MFMESRYMEPKKDDKMAEISGKTLTGKVNRFNTIINENSNKYDWFRNVNQCKFYNYTDYKDISQANLNSKIKSKVFANTGIWTESINKPAAKKHRLTNHFGPTYKDILSHHIAVTYHQTAEALKMF